MLAATPGSILVEASREVSDQFLGLVRIIEFPGLTQHSTRRRMELLGHLDDEKVEIGQVGVHEGAALPHIDHVFGSDLSVAPFKDRRGVREAHEFEERVCALDRLRRADVHHS